MLKNVTLALGFSLISSALFAEIGVGREATCLIVVEAQTFVDGPCELAPVSADGSFDFKSYDGKYWGQMTILDGAGEVWWNGEAYGSHAHSAVRGLWREDACWVNDHASFCFR